MPTESTDIESWIDSVANTSQRQVAIAAEIPIPTLARQIREDSVTPETVVKIARAYEASPIPGFVAIGLITEDEANQMGIDEALRRATDLELAEEVLRRVKSSSLGPMLEEPLHEEHPYFRRGRVGQVQDEAARRDEG